MSIFRFRSHRPHSAIRCRCRPSTAASSTRFRKAHRPALRSHARQGPSRTSTAAADGDQYVRVNIEVPKNLSDKQKKLLREFEETSTDENQVKRKSFWDKVKDALKDK